MHGPGATARAISASMRVPPCPGSARTTCTTPGRASSVRGSGRPTNGGITSRSTPGPTSRFHGCRGSIRTPRTRRSPSCATRLPVTTSAAASANDASTSTSPARAARARITAATSGSPQARSARPPPVSASGSMSPRASAHAHDAARPLVALAAPRTRSRSPLRATRCPRRRPASSRSKRRASPQSLRRAA